MSYTQKYPIVEMKVRIGEGSTAKEPSETIKIELYTDTTPKTAESFRQACQNLENQEFKRIMSNFMCELGVKDGDQQPPIYELNFARKHTGAGVLTTPVTGRSSTKGPAQFYICSQPTPWFDGRSVVFGQVINRGGLELLKLIDSDAGTRGGRPKQKVTITSCTNTYNP